MNIYNLILKRRSIRRFKQRRIPLALLKKFVNAARLAPSSANLQPLEFVIVQSPKLCGKVFLTLGWAGYLKKGAPMERERPVAYIVILVNKKISRAADWDCGAAGENIMLAALERGIGSCPIGTIARDKLREILQIPQNYEINTIIALGYPAEKAVVTKMKSSVRYWRKGKLHFVPKRELSKILYINKF